MPFRAIAAEPCLYKATPVKPCLYKARPEYSRACVEPRLWRCVLSSRACRVAVKPCLRSRTRSACRALGPAPETPTSARRVISAYLGLGLTTSGLFEWVALRLPVELGRWSQACRVVPVEPCQVDLASLKPAPETLDSAYLPRTLRVLRGSFRSRRPI